MAARRAPRRTSRAMASSDKSPEGGDLPYPTCALGCSGFSETVCLPRPPPQQLPLRPVLWIGCVSWEKGNLRSGWQRSKGGQWVAVTALTPLLPTACQVPNPVPLPHPSDLTLSPPFFPYSSGSPSPCCPLTLIPSSSLASQAPVSHSGPSPQRPIPHLLNALQWLPSTPGTEPRPWTQHQRPCVA